MATFFLVCAAFGGGLLVLQLLASLFGLDHGGVHAVHGAHGSDPADHGLNLLSVRGLAAAVAFLGVGGLAGARWGAAAAIGIGLALGLLALVGVALATRMLLRFEDDGTLHIEGAVGSSADVYLAIPARRSGRGKIHLALQNRLVEYPAVTSHDATLPTGARVLVVDVLDDGTVDVAPDPLSPPQS